MWLCSISRERHAAILRRKDELRQECVLLLPFLAEIDSSLKEALIPVGAVVQVAKSDRRAASIDDLVLDVVAELEREGAESDFALKQKAQDLFIAVMKTDDSYEIVDVELEDDAPEAEPGSGRVLPVAAAAAAAGADDEIKRDDEADAAISSSGIVRQMEESTEKFLEFLRENAAHLNATAAYVVFISF